MAWTAPITWTGGSILTAAQLNTYWRDNLKESFAEKATAANQWLVATGANAVAARGIGHHTVSTSQTRVTTTYGDLATSGPTVTITTGAYALVFITGQAQNSTNGEESRMGVEVSGATPTIAATDNYCLLSCDDANNYLQASTSVMFTTLTAGSNTFQAKYRVSGGTGTFLRRHLIVWAF